MGSAALQEPLHKRSKWKSIPADSVFRIISAHSMPLSALLHQAPCYFCQISLTKPQSHFWQSKGIFHSGLRLIRCLQNFNTWDLQRAPMYRGSDVLPCHPHYCLRRALAKTQRSLGKPQPRPFLTFPACFLHAHHRPPALRLGGPKHFTERGVLLAPPCAGALPLSV